MSSVGRAEKNRQCGDSIYNLRFGKLGAGQPCGNRKNPLTGVFACRSPVRPNLIGLSLCKIVSVEGRVVNVEKIDAFDKTPVLDLKPYAPGIDRPKGEVRVPDWL